jgi:hypothetical protein
MEYGLKYWRRGSDRGVWCGRSLSCCILPAFTSDETGTYARARRGPMTARHYEADPMRRTADIREAD